jgi:hypothetical protein
MFSTLETFLPWTVNVALSLFLVAISAYLIRKLENFATHEDVDKLVAQMAAVTKATEEIKAKISNEMWEQQRRWEIKRDAVFDALKELGTFEAAIFKLVATTMTATQKAGDVLLSSQLEWKKIRADAGAGYNAAFFSFNRARRLTTLVCGQSVTDKFNEVAIKFVNLGSEAVNGLIDNPTGRVAELEILTTGLTSVIRADLGIDPAVMPQSSGSSAVQDLDSQGPAKV